MISPQFVDSYTSKTGLDIQLVRQGKELGTGHAVQAALPYLRSDEAVIIYGDLYFEKEVVDKIFSSNVDTLVSVSVEDPWNYGVIIHDGDKVLRILEKPDPSQTISQSDQCWNI
jgi:Nucleoside-diphosphate-sugar pyrophosphorylase involved in lipopolysaccharide biosynthesis/translation initiation factor 2B, gamma/epsilon subunits (eIF-2Bgamma/eIF-2Bepsilon)